MKNTIITVLAILLSLTTYCQGDAFYRQVLSDNRLHSCYLLINRCDSDSYIIENSLLFAMLNKDSPISFAQYQNKMVAVFQCDSTLDMATSNGLFEKVRPSQEVDSIAQLGKDFFFHYYFQDKHLRADINYEDSKRIVYHLFIWGIPCFTDCETGVLQCLY